MSTDLVLQDGERRFDLRDVGNFLLREDQRWEISRPLAGPPKKFSTGSSWIGVFDANDADELRGYLAKTAEIGRTSSVSMEIMWQYDRPRGGKLRVFKLEGIVFKPTVGRDIYGKPIPFVISAQTRNLVPD